MKDYRYKEYKEDWLEALRGDKYKQGTGFLKSKKDDEDYYRYCCLGVLCEVMGSKFYRSNLLPCSKENVWGIEEIGGIKWYSVVNVPEGVIPQDKMGILIEMNDGSPEKMPRQKTFKEIADWIEENL